MPETIESFVDKLQAEGVQAGRQAAEKIRAEAEKHAQAIIHQAEEKAEKIVAEAQAEADQLRARAQTELELAARDAMLRVRDALTKTVQGIFSSAVDKHLSDAEFLKPLIHDAVMQYVQADAKGITGVTINVSDQMRQQLTRWATQTLQKAPEMAGKSVDLLGSLAEAGFEYRVSEGTVEVTVESVVETLSELVSPEIRKLVVGAAPQPHEGDGKH